MRNKIVPLGVLLLAGLMFFFVYSDSESAKSSPVAPYSAKSSTVSSACTAALAKQASSSVDISLSSAQANRVERAALNACKDSAEWINGVIANPSAIGYTTATQSTAESSIDLSCMVLDTAHSTPVCADANQRGLLSR